MWFSVGDYKRGGREQGKKVIDLTLCMSSNKNHLHCDSHTAKVIFHRSAFPMLSVCLHVPKHQPGGLPCFPLTPLPRFPTISTPAAVRHRSYWPSTPEVRALHQPHPARIQHSAPRCPRIAERARVARASASLHPTRRRCDQRQKGNHGCVEWRLKAAQWLRCRRILRSGEIWSARLQLSRQINRRVLRLRCFCTK